MHWREMVLYRSVGMPGQIINYGLIKPTFVSCSALMQLFISDQDLRNHMASLKILVIIKINSSSSHLSLTVLYLPFKFNSVELNQENNKEFKYPRLLSLVRQLKIEIPFTKLKGYITSFLKFFEQWKSHLSVIVKII